MSTTGLTEFVDGATDPQERTLRKVAEVYRYLRDGGDLEELERKRREESRRKREKEGGPRKAGRVAEPRAAYPDRSLDEVRRILSVEDAERQLAALFDLVRRHPDEAPPIAGPLEGALLRCAAGPPPEDGPAQGGSGPRRKK